MENVLGENVVVDICTPRSISELVINTTVVYKQLDERAHTLETLFEDSNTEISRVRTMCR